MTVKLTYTFDGENIFATEIYHETTLTFTEANYAGVMYIVREHPEYEITQLKGFSVLIVEDGHAN